MSDVKHCDLLLTRTSSKTLSALYGDTNKHQKQHPYNPQDVISSVSYQLKAIHNADFTNSKKSSAQRFPTYKSPTFLSVTKLSVLDEEKPKATTKFDTQCVTDTQLMNIIEDAEIIDDHQGMTQEFETAFVHTNTETQYDKDIEHKDWNECVSKSILENSSTEEVPHICNALDQMNSVREDFDTETHIVDRICFNEPNINLLKSSGHSNCEAKQLSQVLQANIEKFRNKQSKHIDIENKCDIDNRNSLEIQTYEQLDNRSETKDNKRPLEERPPSPIFTNKNLKMKSPSPLIFNLDKFEQFETIALSLLNADNNNPVKHVINSQLLNRELHLNVNKDIVYFDTNNISTDFEENVKNPPKPVTHIADVKETASVMPLNHSTQKDFVDNEESQNITINHLSNDEILFSSDEEESYIAQKEHQNLPLTCTLENSCCHQSDILDTTLYVGFQTASNRSIQVSTGSFARAKSLLSDTIIEEMSVAELVNSFDNVNKDKSVLINEKKLCSSEDKPLNSTESNNEVLPINEKEGKLLNHTENMVQEPQISQLSIPNHQMGFITASNKNISLSKQALARCRKVFQDIDLNENFDIVNIKDNTHELASDDNFDRDPEQNAEAGIDVVNSVLEGFDDEIVQEFENIEMSLEDLKENIVLKEGNFDNVSTSRDTVQKKDLNISDIVLSQIIGSRNPKSNESKSNPGSKANSYNQNNIPGQYFAKSNHQLKNEFTKEINRPIEETKITTSDSEKLITRVTQLVRFKTDNNKGIITDLSNDSSRVNNKVHSHPNSKQKLKSLPENKDCRKLKHEILRDKSFGQKDTILNRVEPTIPPFKGFQTDNMEPVSISTKALEKSRSFFEDMDLKTMNNFVINTALTGFQTASNKQVLISKDALAKSRNIFKDIDNLDGINEENKSTRAKALYPDGFLKENPNNLRFIGSEVSKEALAKSRNIFKDLNNLGDIDYENNSTKAKALYPDEILQENQNNPRFIGFQTANNKQVKVSKEALAKSKNILEDIYNLKGINEENKSTNANALYFDKRHQEIQETPRFTGFRTASNKQVQISKDALIKSRNIFKNLDNLERVNDENNSTVLKTLYPDEIHQENQRTPMFTGFQTASNKRVEISKEALLKSRNIFKDIKNFESIHEGSKSLKAKALYPNELLQENQINIKFTGFQTASNKQVQVSKEALAKSKSIFTDLNNFEDSSDKIKGTKAKAFYPDEILQENQINIKFTGFQTASNKQVQVSEEALAKSKSIFTDLNNLEDSSDKNKGTKAKSFYPDEILQENQVNIKFTGFQTASYKQVQVSKEALAKSKSLFTDLKNLKDIIDKNISTKAKALYPDEILQENQINLEIHNSSPVKHRVPSFKGAFEGFQTANKKPVAISQTALVESKKILGNLDTFDQETTELFRAGIKEVLKGSGKSFCENKIHVDPPQSQVLEMFQTASHKEVFVSKDALAKTKRLFHELDTKSKTVQEGGLRKSTKFNIGSQTKKNNPPNFTSEGDLARSKRLFSEIDEDDSVIKKDKKSHAFEENNATLDTQLVDNFNVSLHTEDFIDIPKNVKRAGSPILSCPRAKKRKKFETPYTSKNITKHVVKPIDEAVLDINKLCYKEDYKKNKIYTLKDIHNMAKGLPVTIDPYLLNFDFDNLLQFEFSKERNDITSDNMKIHVLKENFMNSVTPKLVPQGWLDNHLQLILWKLISYEIKFKSVIKCTVRNVLDQLKYRYDKELYNAQRPTLRKIFEKDDIPSKTMILCVLGIYMDDIMVPRVTDMSSNIELLLTDGWYSIRCNIDRMLKELVYNDKIAVGCKIATSGAELMGCEQGVSPWEDTSAVRLKIFGNSTRRAHWDARLGYVNQGPILCPLSSIQVSGGKVSKLRVFVARVYPALYVEKFEDGSTVTRSERLENIHQMKSEVERQAFMEKLYEEVEKEFIDQKSQDSDTLSDMESGSQIAKLMKRSKDPTEFRAQLTDSQLRLLEAHTSKRRDRLIEDVQARVRERLEKAGVSANRNVISLLKIRVAGVTEKGDNVDVSKAMMTIWKPNDAVREVIKEGAWIDVLNVLPTAVRYSEVQISAGRQSVFSASRYKEPEKFKPYTKLLQRQCFSIKDLVQNPAMSTDYNEIDTVGLIFLVEPSHKEFDSAKQSFQNVYLADADKNIICINFWGGLQKFGFQNLLDTGQITASVNLQKRAGNTRKSIPQFRVTEFSYFTQTPKNNVASKILDDLNKKLVRLDRIKFCQECLVKKNNYLLSRNNENISPYRFMNANINTPKHKVFVDSPLLRPNKADDNFNLTGLDFETTFKQDTQLSDEMVKRKKKVNEKIARLKMYGEPPPLSPMHIINRSKNACNSYKSPLLSSNNNSSIIHNSAAEHQNTNQNHNIKTIDNTRTKSDISQSVTNIDKTPQKCGAHCDISNSPVLLNRTYVKAVNPVKINFDVQENNNSNVDHFAEEFDGSPPLSLD